MSKYNQQPTGITGLKGVAGIKNGPVNVVSSGAVYSATQGGWVKASVEINMLDYSRRPCFKDDLISYFSYVLMSWIYFIIGKDYHHFQPNQYGYCYYKGTKLHRDNGPAFITRDGKTKCWFKNGVIHRDDGPAMYFNGAEYWYINGRKIISESEIDEIKFKAFFSKKKNLFTEESNV